MEMELELSCLCLGLSKAALAENLLSRYLAVIKVPASRQLQGFIPLQPNGEAKFSQYSVPGLK